jgi:alpha-L-fucosidase 2
VLHAEHGDLHWRSFAAASPSVIVVEVSGLRYEPGAELTWLPVLARPPRPRGKGEPFSADDLNAPPSISTGVGIVTSTQEFNGGGAFAVVLRRIAGTLDRKSYVLTVGVGSTARQALADATDTVEKAATIGVPAMEASHRAWWHQYYPASFVSLPDARLESFYWIQMYKFGSALRPDGPPLDALGPWYRAAAAARAVPNSAAPAYAPLVEANRPALMEPLLRSVDRNPAQLIADARGNPANFLWTLADYWQYARSGVEDAVLQKRLLPLLERMADANAVPEPMLRRWVLQTIVRSCERLRMTDSRLPKWRQELAAVNQGGVGKMPAAVGKAKAPPRSIRLEAIYPLHLVAGRSPAADRLLQGIEAAKGRPVPAELATAAAIRAQFGQGDAALGDLNRILSAAVTPNAFNAESGASIAPPLYATAAVQNLLLQSFGGRIRVFPAMPGAWKDASFSGLRAEGGFLVGGVWHGGAAQWIRIDSSVGGLCRFSVKGWNSAVVRASSRPGLNVVAGAATGEFSLGLGRGGWAVLAPKPDSPLPPLTPVARLAAQANPYPAHFK